MSVPIEETTLIVGGGIAGINTALEIANSGYKVILVEREPSIGGHMAQFDKTFPTLDCSACILTPKMFDVGNHPNIELMTYSEVEQVDGYVGIFSVRIRKRARKIDTDLCTGVVIELERCRRRSWMRCTSRNRLSHRHLSSLPAGRTQIPGHRHGKLHLL